MSKGVLLGCVALGAVAATLPAGAQQVTTQPVNATADAVDDSEMMVVTGVRASILAAQDIKRQAPSVVEAITLQDLGQFTDTSIAEALKRVPGVQIEKQQNSRNGGADSASIRGLTGSNTTLNGRAILGNSNFQGSNLRAFDLNSVPPEVLSGVSVYKTSTSSQLEPGLAGQIDLQTLRPLDYADLKKKRFFGTGTVSGSYENASKKISPRVGGVIGGTFFDDTLGLYVSALYSKDFSRKNENLVYDDGNARRSIQVLNPDNSITRVNNVTTFNGFSSWEGNNIDERRSLAPGLQWKPTPNIEINAEILYNDFRTARDDQTSYIDFSSLTSRFTSPAVTINRNAITLAGPEGNQTIAAFDSAGVNGAGRNNVFNYASYYALRNKTEFVNYGFNGAYTSDDKRFRASVDYSRTTQDSFYRWVSPYVINNGTEAAADTRGSQSVTFDATAAAALANPANYTSFGGFDEVFEKQTRADRDQVRLDLQYRLIDEVTIKVGGFYSSTNAQFVSANSLLQGTDLSGYFTGNSVPLPLFNAPVPEVSFEGFCRANAAFCAQRNRGLGSFNSFPATSAGSPDDVLGFDAARSYRVVENNTAFYGQADFNTKLFNIGLIGNVGVRAVRIQFDGTAIPGVRVRQRFSNDPILNTGVPDQSVTGSNEYWRILPNFNMTLQPTDDINVRLGIGRSFSLADYTSLAPLGGAEVFLDNSTGPNLFSGGNPQLNPQTAWNYDATFEYYTSYGGAFIASFFYKDVTDLLETDIVEGVALPPLPGLFRTTTTVNRGTGYTYGFELSTNQPLTFLPEPFDGLGFQANYTNITSQTQRSSGTGRFSGFAPYSVNVTAYYDKYGWQARVSYLYRPEVFQQRIVNANGDFYDDVRPARATVDASLIKTIFNNYQIIFTGTNLTGSDLRNVRQPTGITREFNQLSPVYSLGIRGTF